MDIPDQINAASRTLGLGEKATLKEIKTAYKNLAKRHHPDKAGSGGGEQMIKISESYKVLMEYVDNYKYSFRIEDVLDQNPLWQWERNYAEDPTWGKGKTKEDII